MKRVLFTLALAASVAVVSAQTKPAKKAAETKECSKKEGASCCKKEKETAASETGCCSPSSKAKALLKAKPATVKKG